MKRVRITLSPSVDYMPPVYRLLTQEASYLSTVEIINWNVAKPPVGFLLFVQGEYHRLEQAVDGMDNVSDFEIFPNGDEEAYCFLAAEDTTVGRALFENFTRDDLLTVPPIRCHEDGSSTFTLIGTEAAIQTAVDGVPNGVSITIDAVGAGPVAQNTVANSLSSKQREAVQTALHVGYYAFPREASTQDVARELDCAPATASEHLRKAESRIVSLLFSDTEDR